MPDQPNIILINCDDLGYGDIGCYGSTVHRTPRLDQMAREGIRFTDFAMASSVCTPSRAAMMTGCYHKRVGMDLADSDFSVLFPGDRFGLHPDEKTIATCLKEQGYATSLIGKWHLGDQPEFLPTSHGFDHYFGIPYSNDMGIERFPERGWPPVPLMQGNTVVEESPDQAHLTARYADEAVNFIKAHRDTPFFLYFAHLYVHAPFFPDPRFLENQPNGEYGAEVECIDWAAGVLLDALKELGIDDNTVVIFTSDNGAAMHFDGSNAPLRGGKGSAYEGGFRLPFIVRWPDRIAPGQTSEAFCTAMDLLPTCVRLAGGQPPADRIIDGKDITALLTDGPDAKSPHEHFYYYQRGCLTAVRQGDWKLNPHEKTLYNLRHDIGESDNLFDAQPEIVAQFEAVADAARADLGDSRRNIAGRNCRPIGVCESPVTLTHRDPDDPILQAAYD